MSVVRNILAPGIALLVFACSSSATVDQLTYIGKVEGGTTRIAVAVQDDLAEEYVCGSGATLQTHTHWFSGSLAASGMLSHRDGWELTTKRVDDYIEGSLVSPQGDKLAWSASLAPSDTEVGLYDARLNGCRSGVIVYEARPGDACGAQGSYCDAMGRQEQVTPVACRPDVPIRVVAASSKQPFVVEPGILPRVHS